MSQFPPPPPMGGHQAYVQRPQTTNVPAIISLICGIVGCFVITPIVGIITGIIGLAKAKVAGGKGMAIAGIILSVLWIVVGIGVTATGVWGVNKIVALVQKEAGDPAKEIINALIEDPMGTKIGMETSLFGPQAQALHEKLKPLGKCVSVEVDLSSMPKWENVNGVDTYTFDKAVATFDSGETRNVAATRTEREGRLIFTKFDVN
jgi:hypothetical protein